MFSFSTTLSSAKNLKITFSVQLLMLGSIFSFISFSLFLVLFGGFGLGVLSLLVDKKCKSEMLINFSVVVLMSRV